MPHDLLTAIGLITGTSMDGIDAALVRTDGKSHLEPLEACTMAYDRDFRNRLRRLPGRTDRCHPEVSGIERALADHHAMLAEMLIDKARIDRREVDVVGFHGQTIFHDFSRPGKSCHRTDW